MKSQIKTNATDIEKLKNPTFRQDVFHPSRLLYSMVGAILFLFIGWVVPDIYYKNFDKREYLTIEQPVLIDKHTYTACEVLTATIKRTSYIRGNAHAVVEIILVNADGNWVKNTLSSQDFNIDVSTGQIIYVQFVLPCDLADGSYFLKAVISYKFKDIPKTYSWVSDSFVISSSQTDQNLHENGE